MLGVASVITRQESKRKKDAERKRLVRMNMTAGQRRAAAASSAFRMQNMRERNKLFDVMKRIQEFIFSLGIATPVQEPDPLEYINETTVTKGLPRRGVKHHVLQTNPGFTIQQVNGPTKFSFYNADGMFVGTLEFCKDATCIINTTGSAEIIEATVEAIKKGKLPQVTRMALMRPTKG